MMQYRGYAVPEDLAQYLGVESGQFLYVSDQDDQLVQLHYVDEVDKHWDQYCRQRPETHMTTFTKSWADDEESELVPVGCPYEQYRGWVLDGTTRQVVARSFPYTKDVVCTSTQFLKTVKPHKQAGFYEVKEGTIIRVFTYRGTMFFSTHRRLNCHNSKWGNTKTFYQMWTEACEAMKLDLNTLRNENLCFVFLLVHQENQITNQVPVEQPYLLHLDTWKRGDVPQGEYKFVNMFHVDVTLPVPKPKLLSHGEAAELLEKGIAVVSSGYDEKKKYIPPTLNEMLTIRGNDPNIKHRWCVLKDTGLHTKLYEVAPPHMKKQLDDVELEINKWCRDIVEDFLFPCYLALLKNQPCPYQLSSEHDTIIRKTKAAYYQARERFYAHPRNTRKQFHWGKNVEETNRKIKEELLVQLESLAGSSIYRCIALYKKHLRLQRKLAL